MRLAAVGIWLCLLMPGLWAAERTTASFVPADAFFVLYYDGGHPGFKETTLARFFQEPEMREVVAQLQPVAEMMDKKALAKEGVEMLSVLRDISGCEIVLSWVQAGEPGKKPRLQSVLRVGEGNTAPRAAAERAVKGALAKAKQDSIRESAIGDAKVTSYINQEGDPSSGTFVGAFYLEADDLAGLKRMLDPAGPKFAVPGGENRAVIGARFDPAAALEANGALPLEPKLKDLLVALGVKALKSVSLDVIPRGPRLVVRLDIEMAGQGKLPGLGDWFADCPPLDLELLKRVPKAPALVWLTSLDIPGLWDAAWRVAGALDARGVDQAGKSLAELEGKAGLKIRDGLLAPLGRGTVFLAKVDGPSYYAVALQRVRDAQALDQSLMQLGNRLDVAFGAGFGPVRGSLKTFLYRTHTCRYLWLMGGMAAEMPGIVPCYTRLGDVFVFAVNPLDLKSYLDFVEDKAPTILDDPEFKALQPTVPAGATSLFYGKWTDLAVSTYNTVAPWLAAIQGANEQGVPKGLDLANLPSSRLIRRYSGPAIAWSIFQDGHYRLETQGDGVEFLSPQLAPISLAALAGLGLPAMGEARAAARRTQGMNNLRQIGMGVEMYRNQFGHDELYPESLEEMFRKGLVGDWGVLVSPLDDDPPKLPNGMPCSYGSCFDKYPKHRFRGDIVPAAGTPMAWDRKAFQPGKRNVVFFDCHVEMVDEERFGQLLGALDQVVKQAPKAPAKAPAKQGPVEF